MEVKLSQYSYGRQVVIVSENLRCRCQPDGISCVVGSMKQIFMSVRFVFLVFVLIALAGCATNSSSGSSFPRYETRTAYDVKYGEVIATRPIEIEGGVSYIGVWGGSAVGRAIGRSLDNGNTGRIAGSLGGVAGAVAGEAIEKKLTAEDGLEITVRLDNGHTIAASQELDVLFVPGDRVRVLFGLRGSTRITIP